MFIAVSRGFTLPGLALCHCPVNPDGRGENSSFLSFFNRGPFTAFALCFGLPSLSGQPKLEGRKTSMLITVSRGLTLPGLALCHCPVNPDGRGENSSLLSFFNRGPLPRSLLASAVPVTVRSNRSWRGENSSLLNHATACLFAFRCTFLGGLLHYANRLDVLGSAQAQNLR